PVPARPAVPTTAAVHREAVALIALALALVAVLAMLSLVARSALVLRLRLLAARDERRQPVDISLVAAVMALAALMLRTAAILLLLARREELGVAREIGLRIARAERGLLAAALRRRHRALVVALVERLVLHVVAAMRVVARRAFG